MFPENRIYKLYIPALLSICRGNHNTISQVNKKRVKNRVNFFTKI